MDEEEKIDEGASAPPTRWTGWTDYPITELGDLPGVPAPWRQATVLSEDGDKYTTVEVQGIVCEVKLGYIHAAPPAEAIVAETIRMLRVQGGPGKGQDGGYRYRTDDGLGCAVGVWLPDTPDVRRLGGTLGALGVWELVSGLRPDLGGHRELMRQLQRLHDNFEVARFMDHAVDGGWDDWDTYVQRWTDSGWRRRCITFIDAY